MWIKENSPTTKLLVVSGGGYFDTRDYLKKAKELGADYVLHKPIDYMLFMNSIGKLLEL